ncbi:hypothetical protein [Desulfovibrio ferrophilus]|uniref:26S protease regulatory subunit 8 n=1 Tax=Desulfovibrio ferrophilus TaxID=241368 RepID=A0A2Z6AUB5_9BACT|nr:hypothetical protein [Desulfovibrio ferrophilus]BBD06818.1 26S protease regulatory subunit 8 [Desulfovibrio ferrophilus]
MRLLSVLVLVVALSCLWGGSDAWAEGVGVEFQLCTCLGTMADAERLVDESQEAVSGLEAQIRPQKIDGRTVFEIWVWHPEMTPQQLCTALGRASCASARGECKEDGGQ